jgi:hypothetical protein
LWRAATNAAPQPVAQIDLETNPIEKRHEAQRTRDKCTPAVNCELSTDN